MNEEDVAIAITDLRGRLRGTESAIARHNVYMEKFNSFIEGFNATELERERQQRAQHQQNSAKLEEINAKVGRRSLTVTIAGVLIGFASLCVAILAIWGMFFLAKHADKEPFNLFQSAQYNASIEPQDASRF